MRTSSFREPFMPLAGIATIPASVAAVAPLLTDGNEAALVLDVNGNLRVVVGNAAANPVIVLPLAGIADTLTAAGKATAPAAGAAIATLAVTAGTYWVEVWNGIPLGTPVVADINNVVLQNNAVAIGNALANDGSITIFRRVTVAGAVNLTVNAIGAGTAGVTYAASITATRIQ